MSAVDRATPRPGRARTLREDLLDDLRQVAPMPTAPSNPPVSVPVVPVQHPADLPDAPRPGTPTIELRVTPKLWGLRVEALGKEPGFVIGVGPVQLSLTGFRR